MGRDGDGISEHAGKVRVSFMYQGVRCRETWPELAWSKTNIAAAKTDLNNIRAEIRAGTFEYAKWFPLSRKVKTGVVPKQGGARGLTLEEALTNFLATKADKSPNTKKLYKNAAEVWKRIFGAQKRLGELNATLVETTIGEHPFASAKLKNDYLIVLRGALALAHRTDKTWPNPMDNVTNSKRQKPVPKPVDEVQRVKIHKHMHKAFDERIGAYFDFQFETGCRPEEAIALSWSHVDLKRRKVHIEYARSLSITGPVKTHENRYIDLSDDATAAIDVMRKYTYREGESDRVVFQNPVTERHWNDARSQNDHYWKPTLAKLNIAARRAYNTRHTYASLRLSMGADPYYISRQLGHESLTTTLKTYALYIDGAKKEADRVRALMADLKVTAEAAAA
jgi:integrase